MIRLRLRNFRIRLLVFLGVLGPGIITASVDNDPGGICSYSVAGARFGYSLLWTLIPITLALVIVEEMAARMGTVTGKGLSDLIREEYGFRTTFFLMAGLVVANLGTTIAEFAGLASGMSALGVSRFVAMPLGGLLVWTLGRTVSLRKCSWPRVWFTLPTRFRASGPDPVGPMP
jgi:NRAMP (natural resistance-associated macrophage protein)-like metal ion transporter